MSALQEITLSGLLRDMARRFPDRDCVVYHDRPFRYSYARFDDLVSRVAKGFLGIGIKKGSHISIWATNYPEWVVTMFAAARVGAVMVTVNTNYKIFEVEYLLRQSDTDTLIFTDGFKDCDYVRIINELVPELEGSAPGQWSSARLPELKRLIHIGSGRPSGVLNWDDLAEAGARVPDSELAAAEALCGVHDVVNMQYTSGTTGFPKGVMLTHHNILNDGFYIGECMKFSENDRLCIPVPFFHCFGCVLGIMAAFTHGAAIVPVEHFSPVPVMETIQAERCTAVHGVPTMFIAMLEHPDFRNYDFSSLRTGIMAGSPCPVKVMRQAVDDMGLREITIAYGLTEASPVCTQTTADDPIERRVSTIGRALPHMECKVVDPETGLECPPDTPGEFMVRGFNVMKGYYKMPEATARAVTPDGWLHSGDVVSRDKDGYFKVTGRIKDMIIRGGENIYPKEIEDFIYTHPKVSDVQIIGVPSRRYGEDVCACIVPKKGESPTADEIQSFVLASMARHKCPKYVIFMPQFPMTTSGKIQKYKLRELAARELGLAADE